MGKSAACKFQVGEKYTNEKGVFEVLSIQGGLIVMQFENGEQISSDVELQSRIQERREWEQREDEKKAAAETAKPRAATTRKTAKVFAGLQPEDFQDTISASKWRGRDQLGGIVAAHLTSMRYNFNSWAVAKRNEIHWADAVHWKKKKASTAKFYVRADKTSLAWGFYIERPDATGRASADWEAFIEWLRDEENDQWLRGLAHEEGLEVYDSNKSCFGGVIRPREKDWAVEGSSVRDAANALGACIDSWPATSWLDLMIAKRITKAEAVERGDAIVDDIARLISRMLPLYEAALAHG